MLGKAFRIQYGNAVGALAQVIKGSFTLEVFPVEAILKRCYATLYSGADATVVYVEAANIVHQQRTHHEGVNGNTGGKADGTAVGVNNTDGVRTVIKIVEGRLRLRW